jgi:hypothetical protein
MYEADLVRIDEYDYKFDFEGIFRRFQAPSYKIFTNENSSGTCVTQRHDREFSSLKILKLAKSYWT